MERVVYINEEFLPESKACVSFRDRGFVLGDAVFDAERTFDGRIFRLEAHISRLFKSLDKAKIDPGLSQSRMIEITHEVLEKNRGLLKPGEDYWIMQRVTRGLNIVGGELWQSSGPTVIVECTPLPLKARAPMIRDGLDIFTPDTRRVPPECLDPNIKSHNYLNLVLADIEVRERSGHAWAVLLDTRGFLSEGIGSNIFIVRDGVLSTPRIDFVLPGISREVVIAQAERLGIKVEERDILPDEAKEADEAFITSTSFCICPVRSYDGVVLDQGQQNIPGPVTSSLSDAFSEQVGLDFRGQYIDAVG